MTRTRRPGLMTTARGGAPRYPAGAGLRAAGRLLGTRWAESLACWAASPLARQRGSGGPHRDAARPAARSQADPGARQKRADALHQAAAGQRAGQGAGAGVAVAEAAGHGCLQLGDRDRGGREDQQELRQPDPAAGAAGTRHRRGDPRRVGGPAGDAGELERPLPVGWDEQRWAVSGRCSAMANRKELRNPP